MVDATLKQLLISLVVFGILANTIFELPNLQNLTTRVKVLRLPVFLGKVAAVTELS